MSVFLWVYYFFFLKAVSGVGLLGWIYTGVVFAGTFIWRKAIGRYLDRSFLGRWRDIYYLSIIESRLKKSEKVAELLASS